MLAQKKVGKDGLGKSRVILKKESNSINARLVKPKLVAGSSKLSDKFGPHHKIELGNFCGVDWEMLLQKKAEPSSGGIEKWANLKVFAKGIAKRKANYTLGWNGSRLADGKDLKILKRRPKLMKAVVEQLLTHAANF